MSCLVYETHCTDSFSRRLVRVWKQGRVIMEDTKRAMWARAWTRHPMGDGACDHYAHG